jgi:hypothetical protein
MHFLRVLAFLPLLVAARLRQIERRTIARVTEAGADTAERAVLLEDTGQLGAFVQRRLERAGALIAAGNDRYYFDRAAYAAFRGRRRKRALVVITVLVIGLIAFYFRRDYS